MRSIYKLWCIRNWKQKRYHFSECYINVQTIYLCIIEAFDKIKAKVEVYPYLLIWKFRYTSYYFKCSKVYESFLIYFHLTLQKHWSILMKQSKFHAVYIKKNQLKTSIKATMNHLQNELISTHFPYLDHKLYGRHEHN